MKHGKYMERKNFKFTKKTLIITLYAAVFVILAASYGISAMLLGPPPEEIPPDIKNGIIRDEDGELRVYEDGKPIRAGLIMDENGDYYYINSTLKAVRNTSYYVTNNNGLLPQDTYYFGADGRLTPEEERDGFCIDGSKIYYYVNGVLQKGAFEYEGDVYFASRSSGALKTGGYYVYASNSNGLINTDGYYNFGSDGKLLNPPTEDDMKKTGLIRDFDGEVRLYKNGRATYGGLIQDSAGNYYYINSSLIAVRNCSYTISKTNGLLPEGTYNFDRDGKMIGSPSPQPEQ